ncbi:MAG: hypothetical protein VYC39_20235 [Myxococcota bacterium]|nr:hypothetical protein [Myxococcota bacterium]
MTNTLNSATSVALNYFPKEGTTNKPKVELDFIVRRLEQGCRTVEDWELYVAYQEQYAPGLKSKVYGKYEDKFGTCIVEEALMAVDELLTEGGYVYRGANGNRSALSFLIRIATNKVFDQRRKRSREVPLDIISDDEIPVSFSAWNPAQIRIIEDAMTAFEKAVATLSNGTALTEKLRKRVDERLLGFSTKEALLRLSDVLKGTELNRTALNNEDKRRSRDRRLLVNNLRSLRAQGLLRPRYSEVLTGLLC